MVSTSKIKGVEQSLWGFNLSLIIYNTKKIIKSKFAKDTIWLTVAQIVLAFSGILINIIIGNKYGSEDLGVFNQSIAIFFLISAILSFGLNNTTIKKISENPDNQKRNKLIINSNLLIVCIIGFSIFFIGYFTIDKIAFVFSSFDIALSMKILFISIPIYNINKILMSSLTGLRKQKEFSIARIIRWGSLITLISNYSFFYDSIFNIYYSFLISELILFIYLFIKLYHFISLSYSVESIKENLKFGSKTYISEIISFTKDRLDIILVGYFLTKYQMGIFTFSYSFSSGILILSRVFMQNFNPIISNLWENKKYSELKQKIIFLVKRISVVQFFFFIIIGISFNLVVPYIVNLPIRENILIFTMMLLGFFIFSTISFLGSFLVMTGNLNMNIIRVLISLFFSVTIVSSMSYYNGINGAALAVLFSNIFNFMMIVVFTKRIFKQFYNE